MTFDKLRISKKEFPISMMKHGFLQDEGEVNRQKGIHLTTDIYKNYRREGKFFDEILDEAKLFSERIGYGTKSDNQ